MFRVIGTPDQIPFLHPITADSISASLSYLSWHDNTSSLSIAGAQRLQLGKSFKILSIKWIASTDTGSTTVSLYKNNSTTAIVSNTQSPGGSGVLLEWNGINLDYLGGDVAHVSIDPTSVSATDVRMVVKYEFTESL